MSFCFLNARSVCDVKQDGKATVICDHIDDNNLDILSAGRICYQLLLVQKAHVTGGGVAVVYKSSFVTRQLDTPNSKTFELMGLHLRNGSHSTRLIVVYRPPPNTKSGYTASEFLIDLFAHLMDSMAMDASNLLVAGDFNFHLDDKLNNDTRRCIDLLKPGNLTQHVEGPTHVAGHTIDLLITRSSNAFLNNIRAVRSIGEVPPHDKTGHQN